MKRLYILIFLLAVPLVYIPNLTRTIRYDEAYTFLHYADSPVHALLLYTYPNNHFLDSFFVWLSTTLMGTSLIAIRFPSFAAGLLSVAMLYRLGRLRRGGIA
jgi:hypothetical protein